MKRYLSKFILSLLTFLVLGSLAFSQTTFNYTGGMQTFTAPTTGNYQFDCWGAQGGSGLNTIGGYGGFASGTYSLTAGQTINIFVGGQGGSYAGPIGWNGGGQGGIDTAGQHGGSGGGASDIRIAGTSFGNRIIVAGGGAGGGRDDSTGAGGGLIGTASSDSYGVGFGGTGGTQTSGGIAYITSRGATNGTLGIGGDGSTNFYSAGGGGGGGGYFGGGGGTSTVDHGSGFSSGGGGGSSYIDGVTGSSTSTGVQAGNGQIVITALCSPSTITPNMASLPDLTGECSVAAPTAPTATDDCGATITGTTATTFPITAQGITVVTWTYTSGSVTTTQTQNVVIDDVTAPVADIATLADVTAECSVTSLSAPTATDNCGGVVTVTNNVVLPITLQGTTVVTWTYDDGNGNTSTQTQNIVINDVTNPIITIPSTLTSVDQQQLVLNTCMANFAQQDIAQSFIPIQNSINGASILLTDNGAGIGNVTLSLYSTLNGALLASGTDLGVSANEWASVSWPSISITPGATYYLVATGTNGAQCWSGNTSNPYPNGQTYANSGFGAFPSFDYVFTTTYEASGGDICGSTLTYSADLGSCASNITTINPIISDNCAVNNLIWTISGATVDASPISGINNLNSHSFNTGTSTVEYTLSDNNGNISTCSFNVVITDGQVPTVITQDITVQLDATGNVTITAAQVDNGSTDNCGIATMTVSPNAFTCANVGPNTVTLTVTDVNGNVSTGTATVTVQDTVNPTVITQDITVQLDATGNVTITAAQVDNGSTDNCSIATITVSPSDFTCANAGSNTVTLTVTDTFGNVSTGTAIVTVGNTFGDNDTDGIKDNCDDDDDNDGVLDTSDNCGLAANSDQADNDTDGLGDVCDDDDDNDGLIDSLDNCQFIYNPGQDDRDNDGIGDVCDLIEVNVSEAITPNGDGINDTWMIYNIENYPNSSVRVFNRWGTEVFFAKGYQNDWNGAYKNNSQPLPDSGSYYYQLDLNGNGSSIKDGWIYITRK